MKHRTAVAFVCRLVLVVPVYRYGTSLAHYAVWLGFSVWMVGFLSLALLYALATAKR